VAKPIALTANALPINLDVNRAIVSSHQFCSIEAIGLGSGISKMPEKSRAAREHLRSSWVAF
jgi:hypothetical protein